MLANTPNLKKLRAANGYRMGQPRKKLADASSFGSRTDLIERWARIGVSEQAIFASGDWGGFYRKRAPGLWENQCRRGKKISRLLPASGMGTVIALNSPDRLLGDDLG